LESKPLNILVRPCYPFFLKNKLFIREHDYAAHWMEPLVQLKEAAEARGWTMNTWDMADLATADVILSQDLPRRDELLAAKAKAPEAKFILFIWESPLSRPQAWDRRNHELFDAVLTYDPHLVDNKRYFRFMLPLSEPPELGPQKHFTERRPLLLINSNRWIGWLANRTGGWVGLPFLGPKFTGWHVGVRALLTQNRGEQYSHRRKIARLADAEFPDLLDVYGHGWRGEPVSWAHKLIRHRPFACGRGAFEGEKLSLIGNYRFGLAFENIVGDRGYLSEKMFDMLYGGAVPIYLGDERAADSVPADCFVDARQFNGDDRALLRFVQTCDETTWQHYYDAGRAYLKSDAAKVVQPAAFCTAVLGAIEHVTSHR
jgi:hypothetical protein